jgi:hypothetical protein
MVTPPAGARHAPGRALRVAGRTGWRRHLASTTRKLTQSRKASPRRACACVHRNRYQQHLQIGARRSLGRGPADPCSCTDAPCRSQLRGTATADRPGRDGFAVCAKRRSRSHSSRNGHCGALLHRRNLVSGVCEELRRIVRCGRIRRRGRFRDSRKADSVGAAGRANHHGPRPVGVCRIQAEPRVVAEPIVADRSARRSGPGLARSLPRSGNLARQASPAQACGRRIQDGKASARPSPGGHRLVTQGSRGEGRRNTSLARRAGPSS